MAKKKRRDVDDMEDVIEPSLVPFDEHTDGHIHKSRPAIKDTLSEPVSPPDIQVNENTVRPRSGPDRLKTGQFNADDIKPPAIREPQTIQTSSPRNPELSRTANWWRIISRTGVPWGWIAGGVALFLMGLISGVRMESGLLVKWFRKKEPVQEKFWKNEPVTKKPKRFKTPR